jgi:hypothetical protein
MPAPQAAFADLADKKSKIVRHTLNAGAVKDFCAAVARERFGALEPQAAARLSGWLRSAGSKWLLREGRAGEAKTLPADAPDWAKEAQAGGESLWTVSLDDRLARQLGHIADWVADNAPRQIDQLSFEQAIRNTAAWDARRAKLTAKPEAADEAGVRPVGPAPSAEEAHAGARWVELTSADALDREGARMSHCVGSYASRVANGSTRIFSLRDADNQPLATIEARPVSEKRAHSLADEQKWTAQRREAAKGLRENQGMEIVQARGRFNQQLGHFPSLAINDLMDALAAEGSPVLGVSGEANNALFTSAQTAKLLPFTALPAGSKIGIAQKCFWRDDGASQIPENLSVALLTIDSASDRTRWPKKLKVEKLSLGSGVSFLDIESMPEWSVREVELLAPSKMPGAQLRLGRLSRLSTPTVDLAEAASLSMRQSAIAELSATVDVLSLPGAHVRSASIRLESDRAEHNLRHSLIERLALSTAADLKPSLAANGAVFGSFDAAVPAKSKLSVRGMDSLCVGDGELPELSRVQWVSSSGDELAVSIANQATDSLLPWSLTQVLSRQLNDGLIGHSSSNKGFASRQEAAAVSFVRDLASAADALGVRLVNRDSEKTMEADPNAPAPLALSMAKIIAKSEGAAPKAFAALREARAAERELAAGGPSALAKMAPKRAEAFARFASAEEYVRLANPGNDDAGLVVRRQVAAAAFTPSAAKGGGEPVCLLDALLPDADQAQAAAAAAAEHNQARRDAASRLALFDDRRAPGLLAPLVPPVATTVAPEAFAALALAIRTLDPEAPLRELLPELAGSLVPFGASRLTTIVIAERLAPWLDKHVAAPDLGKKEPLARSLGAALSAHLEDLPPRSACARWAKSLDERLRAQAAQSVDADAAGSSLSAGSAEISRMDLNGPTDPLEALRWATDIVKSDSALPTQRRRAEQASAKLLAEILATETIAMEDGLPSPHSPELLAAAGDLAWTVSGARQARAFIETLSVAFLNQAAEAAQAGQIDKTHLRLVLGGAALETAKTTPFELSSAGYLLAEQQGFEGLSTEAKQTLVRMIRHCEAPTREETHEIQQVFINAVVCSGRNAGMFDGSRSRGSRPRL